MIDGREVVGVTVRAGRGDIARRHAEFPERIHEAPHQTCEAFLWFNLEHMLQYIAGRLALPVCRRCGAEGLPCAWEDGLCQTGEPVPSRGCIDMTKKD